MREPTPSMNTLDPDGRYVDRCLVGLGGMGEARLVYDQRLHRTAVMKVVRSSLHRELRSVCTQRPRSPRGSSTPVWCRCMTRVRSWMAVPST